MVGWTMMVMRCLNPDLTLNASPYGEINLLHVRVVLLLGSNRESTMSVFSLLFAIMLPDALALLIEGVTVVVQPKIGGRIVLHLRGRVDMDLAFNLLLYIDGLIADR